MATHDTDNPACPECGKKFSRVASLKAHIMLHEKEENLICAECGDEFSTQVCWLSIADVHRKLFMSFIHPVQFCLFTFSYNWTVIWGSIEKRRLGRKCTHANSAPWSLLSSPCFVITWNNITKSSMLIAIYSSVFDYTTCILKFQIDTIWTTSWSLFFSEIPCRIVHTREILTGLGSFTNVATVRKRFRNPANWSDMSEYTQVADSPPNVVVLCQ